MSREYSLYEKLSAIGISISSDPYPLTWASRVDIEMTIMDSAEAILSNKDSRILSLILSWIKYHGEQVNVERLKKLVGNDKRDLVWTHLFAFYGLSCGQSRWKLMAKAASDRRLANGNVKLAEARARFKEEESWSKGSGFIIPRDSEAAHEKWVLTAQQIAKMNVMYRNRLIFGASWRSDIVSAMMFGAKNPAEAARLACSSYEPAYRVFRDFERAGICVVGPFDSRTIVV